MARRSHFIDLTRYHARFRHGDLTVFLTWGGDTFHPCLVIVPAFAEGHERVTPCVVPLRMAWAWSEAIGDGRHCALTAYRFCQQLRITPSVNACMRLTSIVRSHIGDLLTMPPATGLHFERVVVADAIRTDQSGRERHSEISERV